MHINGNFPLELDTVPWFFFRLWNYLFKGAKHACGPKLPFLPRLQERPDLHQPFTGTQLDKLLVSKYPL